MPGADDASSSRSQDGTIADRPRRVLFFDAYPHLYAGGQRATMLVVRGLAERGWPVAVALPGRGPFLDALHAEGVPTHLIKLPAALSVYGRRTTGRRAALAVASLPLLWARLARWLRGRADIVHLADHRGQLLFAPAAAMAGIPVVWHIHGIDRTKVLNLVGSALAKRIVVPSDAMARDMPGLRRSRVTVSPYALPPEAFGATRQVPDRPTVVSVARLHPDKGLDILLRATAELRRHFPTVRTIIAGPAQVGFEGYEDELRQLGHDLGLDGVVDFRGSIPRARPLLEEASVYVQSSRERTEMQPIAILEAMAVGLPVVASAVGGIPEMLGAGERGVLVEPEDAAGLAEAVGKVLSDPVRARAVGDRARGYVTQICSADRMVDQIEAVYRSL